MSEGVNGKNISILKMERWWLWRLFMPYGQELLNFKTTRNMYYERPWANTLIYTMIATCIAPFKEQLAYIL